MSTSNDLIMSTSNDLTGFCSTCKKTKSVAEFTRLYKGKMKGKQAYQNKKHKEKLRENENTSLQSLNNINGNES
ncbi:16013_t:CDS:2 [Racocetra fulgida]|uniref:16013_t:CDS:1 n=1 Tax=Racocetra fulgida TaxID=60492 RepID=A0A9N8Z7D6_9GLOM|nr:16013_t:CDS:2 [Racocetra fulgida]